MPAFNFSARFADLVESGKKRQTIRAERKRPFKVGDRAYLYTGMRTKKCRKLGEGRVVQVLEVVIDRERLQWETPNGEVADGIEVPAPSALADDMARQDGFRDYTDMADWFEKTHGKTHGLPFCGVLVRWVPA